MTDQESAKTALREFLATRRARVTPEDAGLPSYGTRRRVKGLRREEVALLAGISPEYYIRLERGTATGPSATIVDHIATALRLDQDERLHLERLVAALTPAGRRKRPPAKQPDAVGIGIQTLLDSLTDLPAFVSNSRLDVVATNALGRMLYAPYFETPAARMNTARFLFLHEGRSRSFWPQWDNLADDVVAILRAEAGRNPNDPALIELVGQLSTRSEEFRLRWATNNVRAHRAGSKMFHHPLVGDLSLPFENLQLDSAAGLVMTVFTPQPQSPAHDALRMLASWTTQNTNSTKERT